MVHQYKLNGYNIVIDTASGSVHCVDDAAYDAIALYETETQGYKSAVPSCISRLQP